MLVLGNPPLPERRRSGLLEVLLFPFLFIFSFAVGFATGVLTFPLMLLRSFLKPESAVIVPVEFLGRSLVVGLSVLGSLSPIEDAPLWLQQGIPTRTAQEAVVPHAFTVQVPNTVVPILPGETTTLPVRVLAAEPQTQPVRLRLEGVEAFPGTLTLTPEVGTPPFEAILHIAAPPHVRWNQVDFQIVAERDDGLRYVVPMRLKPEREVLLTQPEAVLVAPGPVAVPVTLYGGLESLQVRLREGVLNGFQVQEAGFAPVPRVLWLSWEQPLQDVAKPWNLDLEVQYRESRWGLNRQVTVYPWVQPGGVLLWQSRVVPPPPQALDLGQQRYWLGGAGPHLLGWTLEVLSLDAPAGQAEVVAVSGLPEGSRVWVQPIGLNRFDVYVEVPKVAGQYPFEMLIRVPGVGEGRVRGVLLLETGP